MSDAERMAERLRQWIIDDAPKLFAEIERLRADRDALREDAQRYRWLQQCFMRETAVDRWHGAMWDSHIHDPDCVGLDAAIDAAIDAARRER